MAPKRKLGAAESKKTKGAPAIVSARQGREDRARAGPPRLPLPPEGLRGDAAKKGEEEEKTGGKQERAGVEGLVGDLRLAGRPLEAPRICATGWRRNQHFSVADDPDRTQEPWEPPTFTKGKDPAEQRARTIAEELEIGRVCGATGASFARVVRSVLEEEDCATLIESMNRKGFTPALINIGRGSQCLIPEARDGHRVIVDSPELTQYLLEVLRPHLPQQQGRGELVDLNERCRFLCYTPGQQFAPHHDGCYTRPPGQRNAGDCSRVTVQLYLHDVPAGHGGGTTFLDANEEAVAACQPGAGDALIFTQDLYHEGSLLAEGLKYTLRTEAMYRDPPPPEHQLR